MLLVVQGFPFLLKDAEREKKVYILCEERSVRPSLFPLPDYE